MLRADGSHCIYVIQHDYHGDSKWCMSNLDAFGVPRYTKWDTTPPQPDCFNAVGKCWQKTGIIGVFDLEVAKAELKWIREKNPNMTFRLVALYVMQATVPVMG